MSKISDLSNTVWIIGSAWPYVNFVPHLGNLVGSALSADVFARYLRLRGARVYFVSGSDVHGTPIEVEARKLGVDPRDYATRMHHIVKKLFEYWNISYDNYTWTESEIHVKFVQEFFLKLYERGYIFEKEDKLPYCPKDRIFLPDRFIVGTCPHCGYEYARGDQCEKCGALLEPHQLINPKCAICGSTPEWRVTKHWYLDLRKLEDKVREYIERNDKLPDNVKSMSLGVLQGGLRPRSVTRDNKWGIPAPFAGAEDKTIYVWFEAVLGYITATMEYFARRGLDPQEGLKLWKDPNTRVVFFIGKDNIPFHSIILPALLLASGENYVLPYTISATEYLLYEGKKFSKSHRVGIWIDEALKILDVDYWRFVLIYMRPETRDSSFTWNQALDLINSILNDTIGNFIHRVLSLIDRRLGGVIPEFRVVNEIDREYLRKSEEIFYRVTELYDNIKLREALQESVEIARLGNKFLNERRPWELLKINGDEAISVLSVGLQMIKMIAFCLYPVIPNSISKLWRMLGYSDSIENHRWNEALEPVPAGQKLRDVKPLFTKISRDLLESKLRELEEDRKSRWSRTYPWEQVVLQL